MDSFINKINNKSIWIVLFFIILFINIICMKPTGDDLVFGTDAIWPSNITFMEAAINRYMQWSPRIFSDWLTYFFTHYFFLFKIINSMVITLFIYLIYKLVNILEYNSSFNSFFICIFFICIYPWKDMQTAGTATTLIFYLWPFTALLYVTCILIKYNDRRKILNIEYILCLIALFFSITVEQTVTYLVFFLIITIIYNEKNKKINTFNIITLCISLLGLVFILISPGEKYRYIIETGNGYPTYEMLSFFDKINIGITSTMFHFIKIPEAMILYLFFIIGLLILIHKKYFDRYYYILLMVNFIWILIGMHIEEAVPIFPGMENFKMLDAFSLTKGTGYLPTFISMLLLLWPCIGLYLMYVENRKKCFIIISLYIFSFCDRFILGFSPVVYGAMTRTYLPAFIILILLNCIIYIKIFNKNRI